ncbi:MAG TPA: type IV pilus assembly protein PilM [Syntrophorhabdaceae bacterium]|nr:type IV pilus assembly protein PilM [Syntrophorhabdaceae bacterium]
MTNPFEIFGLVIILVYIVMYLFGAYVAYRIGSKFGIGAFWEYLIPFYNIVLLCRCGGVSAWNVLGLMIPIVNIYSTVSIWGSIAEKLGKSYWLYGITILLFGIPILILAFDSSTPEGEMTIIREPIFEQQAEDTTPSAGYGYVEPDAGMQRAVEEPLPEEVEKEEGLPEFRHDDIQKSEAEKPAKIKAKKNMFESLKQSGMFSSFVVKQITDLVGVDIGTTSIKLCILKNLKGSFSIQNVIKKTYEQELISDGHIVDIDFLSQELRDIFNENNIKTRNAACALSSYSVISKKIGVPFMDDDALENMISVEVENAIPFPIKDIYYSYYVQGVDPEKQNMMNVKIVAVKKEIVDAYIATFNMAGLSLQILDVDMFGISNVVEQVYAPKENSVLIVDIGASVTNIAILNGENIEFTREILMGGKYLTGQIQKSIKVKYKDAEQKKLTANSDVVYLFEDFIFNISSEINKTVRFYLATKPKENIGKIYVTGGSSLLPGIKEKIVDETGITVEVIDPFLLIEGGSGQAGMYDEMKEFMVVPVYLSTRITDLMA